MKYILWWNLVKKPPRIESCNNRISTSFEVPISKISRRCLSHQIASYFGRKTTARISPKLGNFSYFIQPPQDPYSPCSPLFRPLCSSPPSPLLLSRPVPRSEALVRDQRRRLTSSTSFLPNRTSFSRCYSSLRFVTTCLTVTLDPVTRSAGSM